MKRLFEWKDEQTGKEMFDYQTGTWNNIKDIFSLTKTGTGYDDRIPENDPNHYWEEHKGQINTIEYLSPREYYEWCAKYVFTTSSVEQLMKQRQRDKESLDTILTVIRNHRRLPLTYINIADKGQEGLHRMYVLGQLYGWDNIRYPVLITRWKDNKTEENIRLSLINSKLDKAIKNALEYKFTNYAEFFEEFDWELSKEFRYFEEYDDLPEVPYTVTDIGNAWLITCMSVTVMVRKDELRLISPIDDIDI